MIDQTTIDKVFEASILQDVISDFVQLKKVGTNLKGLSPFSDEKTPSFIVSPVKQIWKDFSSGKGGNVVSFLMEYEHYSYPEAIRYLAKKYNIEIEQKEVSNNQKNILKQRESMFLINEHAKKYFSNILKNNKNSLAYLYNRGFKIETINKFNLGYSLDQWDSYSKNALKEGYKLDYLAKTGLTILLKNGKYFDRFKGRLIFPIHSISGKILGFGGRILTDNKKTAKYINSPESSIYHKSNILYGLYQSRKYIIKNDNCYIVEGYTDVIQLHQNGIQNVVASCGTSITSDQIKLIKKFTNNITLLFDGDNAGLNATNKAINIILENGLNVNICTFPFGVDPDSFAKSNTNEQLKLYLKEHSKDFIEFKASILNKDYKNDPIKKASIINDIVTSISKIKDGIKKELFLKKCSKIMGISENSLIKHKEKPKYHKKKTEKINYLYELEKALLSNLLFYSMEKVEFIEYYYKEVDGNFLLQKAIEKKTVFEKIYLSLQDDETEFSNSSFKEIYKAIQTIINEKQSLNIELLINKLNNNSTNIITDIVMNEQRYILHDWNRENIFIKHKNQLISQKVTQNILSLRCYLIALKIKSLKNETKPNIDNSENLKIIIDYLELKKKINTLLNN